MVRASVSGWIGAAPYWSVCNVPRSSASSSSSISMTVGTTSTCVVPTSASARHTSVVKRGKAITDAPDANATVVVAEPHDVVERGGRREAAARRELAQRGVDTDPQRERILAVGHRARRASRARRVQDHHERVGSRIEVERALERPGTSSTAARAPVPAPTSRAVSMNSGSASTTAAPRSCTQRASSSTVSLGPSGASGRPDPVAPIARAKAGAVDVTSATAGTPSGAPSSSSRSAAPATRSMLDTRPHVATCDHRRLVVALPLRSDQRRPRSTTAGHGSLRLTRASGPRRDRAVDAT